MTHLKIDDIAKLSELADRLSRQQQGFKVGDVIESKNAIVAPEGSKGIVILEYVEDSPPDYDIYWYCSGVGDVLKEDLRHCQGTEEKSLCSPCEYNDLCLNLYEITRCDISEFGEWRVEGKPDYYVCQQRKCRHLDVCRSEKWLPGSE